MLATTLWTGSIAAGMAAPTQELAYLWAILRMAGVIATPVLWLIFAVRFAQVNSLNRPLFFLLLSRLLWVSFILMDCDLFKDINDRYGHLTGDQALVALA